VNALCEMTGLNRAGFYRRRVPRQATPVEMELRDQMQKVAAESPAYGYRRITAELQQRGFDVNHKRVLRMMREDNLLCVRQRAFMVTTDSRHNLPVYPNLAREMKPTAINQLWVADITYVRLRTEFVYLAVVLDAFSRRVIGWALGRTLEAQLAVAALRMALVQRQPAPGLVHHSDRGVQYASHDYTEMLKQHKATISMSRKGNPYDNAACESFMKTLKCEEVVCCERLACRGRAVLYRRWRMALRSQPAGAGFKPPQAAGVKSPGGERCGKGGSNSVR
jgi:putative transposase